MAIESSPIELLKQFGDLLERHMFAEANFAGEFSVYPEVWSRYILPNRETKQPTITTGSWRRLAEHNYTAIVRCWNTRTALQRITDLCTKMAAEGAAALLLLELHEAIVTFFASAGAAIDNLRRSFEAEPACCSARGDAALRGEGEDMGSLRWIYERRTQSVHKILVPCYELEGVPSLDVSLFSDTETHWDDAKGIDSWCVASLFEYLWSRFSSQMNGAWAQLFDQLKDKKPPANPEEIVKVTATYTLNWSSGTPQNPRGTPNLIAPSGCGLRDIR
jgi:hypothetical protein